MSNSLQPHGLQHARLPCPSPTPGVCSNLWPSPLVICAPLLELPLCVVQFSHSVMSNSLRSHGLQHARLPCPLPTPKACSSTCPSSQWCHPTLSSSVIPFSSHLQSFPASESFLVSQFFASGGQSIGASASDDILYSDLKHTKMCYLYPYLFSILYIYEK